jgi:hypothetical protein
LHARRKQNPPRRWPGGSSQPHFLIVSLGTTNNVTQATHGVGKFHTESVADFLVVTIRKRYQWFIDMF